MICPYSRKSETQVIQLVNEYDENNNVIKTEQVMKTDFTLMECQKQNCGVGYANRCHYYTTADEVNE